MSLDADIGNLVASSQALVDTFEKKAQSIESAVQAALSAIPESTRTYFVDQVTGDDSASGTQAAPLQSIQEASSRVPHGGTVQVNLLSNYTFELAEYYDACSIIINGWLEKKELNFTAVEDGDTVTINGINSNDWLNVHLTNLTINLPDTTGLVGSPVRMKCVGPRNSGSSFYCNLKVTYADILAPENTASLMEYRHGFGSLTFASSTATNMDGKWILDAPAGASITSVNNIIVSGISTL